MKAVCKKSICIFIFFLFVFTNIRVDAATDDGRNFRGIWVSTIMNLDYPSKDGLTAEKMKLETIEILDLAKSIGLNSIILQVRPAADALYRSFRFPWSKYLTGEQGREPEFDPLEFWVSEAHLRGLELHAWINPYRVAHHTEKIAGLSALSSESPAHLYPDSVVKYSDGGYYFDPGRPEVTALVIQGIVEIILNYDVDGIHMDDYFYPGTDFNDNTTYAVYGGGLDRDSWRRENVNTLVRETYAIIKELRPGVIFGISPSGIWRNYGPNSPLGSDTRGMESYVSLYADTRLWVKEGWLDYICPQIYWSIGYSPADYAKLAAWWSDVCDGTGVDLYIGHAAYKEYGGNFDRGEIIRQLELNNEYPQIKGSIFFRIGALIDDTELSGQIKSFYNKSR